MVVYSHFPECVIVVAASIVSSKQKWKEFFTRYYKPAIQQLAVSDARTKSLTVEFQDIVKFDVRLSEELLSNPGKVLKDAEDALPLVDLPVKRKVSAFVRIVKIPRKMQVRDLRSDHINTFVSIEGTVRKITDVRPRIINAAFECARCGNILYLPQEGTGKFLEPSYCPCNEEKKGVFRLLFKESTFEDYQRIKIQESPEDLKGGEQPQTLDINVSNDLAGIATPGERIVVNGILRSIQKINRDGKTVYFDIYMDCNSIEFEEQEFDELEITPEDEEAILKLSRDPNIFKKITNSIAPSIYGYDEVKEAIALQLFSGIVKNLPDGTRIRGDIHVLLVGDPGIAKSQILRYVVNLAPRGVYASGKSASSAGLTAAAVKDDFDGSWTLEAGALVLADKGIAAIDEIDKMKPEDRSALHEAMEQQSISVAKAGILATLKCRCALLGAANPKLGRFDPFDNIADQINMPPSLMSRFDLIFILQDKPDEKRDASIAGHILKSHYAGELNAHKLVDNSSITDEALAEAMKPIKPDIDSNLLRKYIAYAKRKIFPIMTDEARERITKFYLELRKPGEAENSPIAVTARQLEGLVRLSEASARMRLSDRVTPEDVERTINIIMTSLKQVGMDRETGKLDIDILTVGVGKSQRERIKDLKNIIVDLAHEYGTGGVPLDKIIEKAGEHGMAKDKVEKEIKKLKEIGEIFEPRVGYYSHT
ncbi:replicative DNA helicase Mcm [Methanocella conradii HZ254]|uniref:Replicative DNA helicase Mcm n=1 Tax=Methanocella conradii (strain DSM 24694 / JCM 17849 / CGMCC 1.5162 / HZ254) TaxID=1041930 RepID=H8I9P9_METCZ|nr:replicative DNA helicase Mcm [Methanocella conradii HZ254]